MPSPPDILIPPKSLSAIPVTNLGRKPLFLPIRNSSTLSNNNFPPCNKAEEATLPIGFKPSATGLKSLSLNHVPRLSLISCIDSLRGSVICLLIAPAIPPRLTPSLSLEPNMSFLNTSVVDSIPIPAPSILLPNIPNGPRNKAPKVVVAICGNARLIAAFLSLLSNPPSLPKMNLFKLALFLRIEAPTPIIAPPNGPKGVSNPAIIPVVPYFLASGAYFSKIFIVA